ncbi:hypothetical protein BDW75DRAFT_201384 [Aspergillus navahoensis]
MFTCCRCLSGSGLLHPRLEAQALHSHGQRSVLSSADRGQTRRDALSYCGPTLQMLLLRDRNINHSAGGGMTARIFDV